MPHTTLTCVPERLRRWARLPVVHIIYRGTAKIYCPLHIRSWLTSSAQWQTLRPSMVFLSQQIEILSMVRCLNVQLFHPQYSGDPGWYFDEKGRSHQYDIDNEGKWKLKSLWEQCGDISKSGQQVGSSRHRKRTSQCSCQWHNVTEEYHDTAHLRDVPAQSAAHHEAWRVALAKASGWDQDEVRTTAVTYFIYFSTAVVTFE